MSIFETLNQINVNEHTEKKNGLTYLSWAWAWAEVKKAYPSANYKIYETANGCFYFTDGKTCWVKTSVTIEGLEHIEYLPVMDNYNKSIPLEKVTSFDINKAIQRSLTKAAARHGLGLYIYAGEDLPDGEEAPQAPQTPPSTAHRPSPTNLASDKQKSLVAKLLEERGLSPETYGVNYETLTALQASDLINRLFQVPKQAVAKEPVEQMPLPDDLPF